ncbi:MAG: uroporphyrinogen-III C-methyltransferase [Thermacetogeniaceae bacterium]
MEDSKSIVYLVGAGPGDPSLFTLKGLRCLERADVVVYDRLVCEYLLTFCRNDAELVYVGKETDHHTLTQDQINQVLVDRALQGKTVCRLKGGDPFMFGRGGEEAAYLAAAGIDYEIVPGVSAAVAVPAYAGIPVTHREYAAALTIATGHRRREQEAGVCPGLRANEGTAVFLMGFENLSAIRDDLLAKGWRDDTPAALIYWGTRAEQQTVTGTLDNLQGRARTAGIGPPSVLVVGRVVELRQQLCWRERMPLFGKRILITRAPHQMHEFAKKVLDLGGEPQCLPVLELAPPQDLDPLDRALEHLGDYQWVIFTSANGVSFLIKRMQERGIDIRSLRGQLAALGPATAQTLARHGLQVAFTPVEYRAEALLDGLLGMITPGSRVLLPRAAEARNVLPEGLRSAGVHVDVAPAYRTLPGGAKYKRVLQEVLTQGQLDYLTFTSSSAIKYFQALFDEKELADLLGRGRVACIGPVTASTAAAVGIRVDLVAQSYTTAGLLEAIISDIRSSN